MKSVMQKRVESLNRKKTTRKEKNRVVNKIQSMTMKMVH